MMEGFTDPGLLATIPGAAVFVMTATWFVKRWLRQRFGVTEETPDDAPRRVSYNFAMNITSLALGIVAAIVGSAVAFPIGPETNVVAWIARAVLIGLFGTLVAVGGDNVTGNVRARL